MIAIRVVSRAGVPLTAPLLARFADTIGDIGRGADCTLVLPDPDRKISRKQALVTPRGDGHFLCPIGANLIVELDGEPLAPDAEYALMVGAEIRIGPYLLKVERVREVAPRMEPPVEPAAPSAVRRPAAPVEQAPPVPARAPRLEPPAGPAPVPPTMFAERDRELDDPLEIFDRPRDQPHGGPRASVFRDLLGSPSAPTPAAARATPPRVSPMPIPVPAPVPPPPVARPAPVRMPPPAGAPAPVRPASPPTLPASPSPLPPPPRQHPGAYAQRPAPHDAPARVPVVPASPPPAATREVDIHVGEPTGSGARRMRRDKTGSRSDIRSGRAEPAEPAGPGVDELVNALYQGLNMPQPGAMARSPQQMRLVGELLREAISGTLDLLAARTIAKRELGASSTLLQARENNPLKFSPDTDAALGHLLGPPERGFIGPQAAVHDAFGDLRAHQVAVLAGMRAALDAVLARFDPAALEVRLAPPGMLENLVPATRRAKLWENYGNQYAQILREVEGDFDTLFGRAFLQAYKAQLEEFARASTGFGPQDDGL